MNAEAKHKIETANSTQESLLKCYYSRLPERRARFESTCCGEVLSLQRAIQTANGHETELGIFSYHYHVCALQLSVFLCVEYQFLHKSSPPGKELHLQPAAECQNKIMQQKVTKKLPLFFLVAGTLRNCVNFCVVAVLVTLDNKTSHLKPLSRNIK